MVTADVPPLLRRGRSAGLRRVAFEAIPRTEWDGLHALAPATTPFSSWTFHRAWWDAYGESAEEHYLALIQEGTAWSTRDTVRPPNAVPQGDISGIVPLMVRSLDRRAGGDGTRTVHFAASYHADYATALAPLEDLAGLSDLLAGHLVGLLASGEVDRVDLRRLAESDPLLDLLSGALSALGRTAGLTVRVEPEDVCPVIDLAQDWHTQLGQLDKKSRHEVRRKLRRAELEGRVELRYLPLDTDAAERFIRLHQARWGDAGLFAEGPAGDRSRVFLRRLAELEGAAGATAGFHIGEVSVAGRPIYALAGFADGGTCYFYNAGMDPAVLDLSPGIVGTATYLRDRIERGDGRFDFLRGDEAYKYKWGARDTRLVRLVADRADGW